MINTYIIAILL